MKCPNSNHENPDSNKFCAECGTKLEVMSSLIECPQCHNIVPEDSKFCPDCGTKIEEQVSDDHSHVYIIYKQNKGYNAGEKLIVYDVKGNVVKELNADRSWQIYTKESSDRHQSLYAIPDADHDKQIVITAKDGVKTLAKEQSHYSLSRYSFDWDYFFSQKHPEYVKCEYLGVSTRGLLFACYKNEAGKHGDFNADILTEDGTFVFEAKDYTCVKALGNVDRILIDYGKRKDSYEYDGNNVNINFVDLQGNEVLQKPISIEPYDVYSIINAEEQRVKEHKPDSVVIHFYDKNEPLNFGGINMLTGERFHSSNDIMFDVKKAENLFDVYSCATGELIYSNADFSYVGQCLHHDFTYQECHGLLRTDGTFVKLSCWDRIDLYEPKYMLYSMTQSKYVDTYKDFISENRIFAGIRKSSDPLADVIGFYIYDFSGKEIAYKDARTIVKRPYMYGKAIFIKDYYTYRAVGYLDMNGNEHVIPYKISHMDESGKTIDIKDVDCELLTPNILCITNGLRDTVIDLNGIQIESERLDRFFGIGPGIYLKGSFRGDLIVYNSESKEIFRCNYLEKDSIYVVY